MGASAGLDGSYAGPGSRKWLVRKGIRKSSGPPIAITGVILSVAAARVRAWSGLGDKQAGAVVADAPVPASSLGLTSLGLTSRVPTRPNEARAVGLASPGLGDSSKPGTAPPAGPVQPARLRPAL